MSFFERHTATNGLSRSTIQVYDENMLALTFAYDFRANVGTNQIVVTFVVGIVNHPFLFDGHRKSQHLYISDSSLLITTFNVRIRHSSSAFYMTM